LEILADAVYLQSKEVRRKRKVSFKPLTKCRYGWTTPASAVDLGKKIV